MITFLCQHCSFQIKVSEKYANKRGKCPKCGNIVQVPSVSHADSTQKDVKIKFLCNQCNQKIAALPQWIGKKVKCPKCGSVNNVTPPRQDNIANVTAVNNILDKQSNSSLNSNDGFASDGLMNDLLTLEKSGTEVERPDVPNHETRIPEIETSSSVPGVIESQYRPYSDSGGEDAERSKKSGGNLLLSILCGIGGAILGAIIWAFIASLTRFELGIVAIGVGALAGWGITIFQNERNVTLGILAAVFAVLGIFMGKVFVARYVIAPQVEKIFNELSSGDSESSLQFEKGISENLSEERIKKTLDDENLMSLLTAMYLSDKGEFSKTTLKSYYSSLKDEQDTENNSEETDRITKRVYECLDQWDVDKKRQVIVEQYPKLIKEVSPMLMKNPAVKTKIGIAAFLGSFSFFDLLWFPFAIWSAFKIGSGND